MGYRETKQEVTNKIPICDICGKDQYRNDRDYGKLECDICGNEFCHACGETYDGPFFCYRICNLCLKKHREIADEWVTLRACETDFILARDEFASTVKHILDAEREGDK